MSARTIRTFGDLQKSSHVVHRSSACSFCKRTPYDGKGPYPGARQYSARHYICDACIERRRDEVLPRVRKAERFEAEIEAIRERERAKADKPLVEASEDFLIWFRIFVGEKAFAEISCDELTAFRRAIQKERGR